MNAVEYKFKFTSELENLDPEERKLDLITISEFLDLNYTSV